MGNHFMVVPVEESAVSCYSPEVLLCDAHSICALTFPCVLHSNRYCLVVRLYAVSFLLIARVVVAVQLLASPLCRYCYSQIQLASQCGKCVYLTVVAEDGIPTSQPYRLVSRKSAIGLYR